MNISSGPWYRMHGYTAPVAATAKFSVAHPQLKSFLSNQDSCDRPAKGSESIPPIEFLEL